MQTSRSFFNEGKYPIWVKTVITGLVVNVTKLNQAISAADNSIKQNLLISQHNKLLSYMNSLSIELNSIYKIFLKRMKEIGRRSWN